jgi:hypothetical protein
MMAMPVQFSLPRGTTSLSFRCTSHAGAAVSTWTIADVGTFLEYIEIAELKETFAIHAIRGAELIRQTDSSLQTMGVDKLGHRKVPATLAFAPSVYLLSGFAENLAVFAASIRRAGP